jgi:hypothetical protein
MRNILDLGYVHMTLAVETDVKPNYRYQLVELAVVLLPRRGARGEDVVVRATVTTFSRFIFISIR